MRRTTTLGLPLLLAAQALAKEDLYYNPDENYRPRNVTGLDYYYYPRIGSCVYFIFRPRVLQAKEFIIGTTMAVPYSPSPV